MDDRDRTHRSQRNETAVRWFLLSVVPPADQCIALERELVFTEEEIERLQALAERLDAAPPPPGVPFDGRARAALNSVMREWLIEQLTALD